MHHKIGKIQTLLLLLWAACAYGEPLSLDSHRFSRHSAAKYERLVLEFGGGSVGLTVSQNSAGGLTRNLVIPNGKLSGAVPESKINQSFRGSARYLSAITLNPFFPPEGFSVSIELKDPEVQVAAFWLTAPSRLVIDAYPLDSPRALGLNNLPRDKGTKSLTAKGPRRPASSKGGLKRGEPNGKYACFPVQSKVGLNVHFLGKDSGHEADQFPVKLHGTANKSPVRASSNSIVCYPRAAEVVPRFSFSAPQLFQPTNSQAGLAPKPPAPPTLPPSSPDASAGAGPMSKSTIAPLRTPSQAPVKR